jgi:hypothetical protein
MGVIEMQTTRQRVQQPGLLKGIPRDRENPSTRAFRRQPGHPSGPPGRGLEAWAAEVDPGFLEDPGIHGAWMEGSRVQEVHWLTPVSLGPWDSCSVGQPQKC